MPVSLPPLEALWVLCLLLMGLCVFDGLLRALTTSRESVAAFPCILSQGARLSPYWYLVGGIWVLHIVLGVVLGALGVAVSVLQGLFLGFMLLLTIAPWWGLRGLTRYFAFAQGLSVTLGASVWPALVSWPHRRWLFIASGVGYVTLFVVIALWCRHRAS